MGVRELTKNHGEVHFRNEICTIKMPNHKIIKATLNKDELYVISFKTMLSLMGRHITYSSITEEGDIRISNSSTERSSILGELSDESNTSFTTNDSIGSISENTATLTDSKVRVFSKEQQRRALEYREMHRALAHPSDEYMINAFNSGVIIGTRLTATDVRNAKDIYGPCLACLQGKAIRPSYKASNNPPATKVGDVVHVDIIELSKTSLGGSTHILFSVDEFSACKSLFP